jgi:hypothetical protein
LPAFLKPRQSTNGFLRLRDGVFAFGFRARGAVASFARRSADASLAESAGMAREDDPSVSRRSPFLFISCTPLRVGSQFGEWMLANR